MKHAFVFAVTVIMLLAAGCSESDDIDSPPSQTAITPQLPAGTSLCIDFVAMDIPGIPGSKADEFVTGAASLVDIVARYPDAPQPLTDAARELGYAWVDWASKIGTRDAAEALLRETAALRGMQKLCMAQCVSIFTDVTPTCDPK